MPFIPVATNILKQTEDFNFTSVQKEENKKWYFILMISNLKYLKETT